MKYKALIDYSTPQLVLLIVQTDGKTVVLERQRFSARESGGIHAWIIDTLHKSNIKLKDIETWYSGIGPGSFTGLRGVSAMVMGFARGANPDNPQAYGIPSALGLIQGIDALNIAVLYDGRNHEVLFYGLSKESNESYRPSGKNGVIHEKKLAELATQFDQFIALDSMRSILENAPFHIHYVSEINPETMIHSTYTENITEPIYLRPAVFVEPKPIREV